MTRATIALATILGGCYDPPKPQCGFRCGPSAACPADYTCGSDNHCHLVGAPAGLACAPPDAAPPDAYTPRVVATNPTAGAVVDPATTVQVDFDVDVANVNETSFTLILTATTTPIAGAVSYEALTHRATFVPASELPRNVELQAKLHESIYDPTTGRPLMPATFVFRTQPDMTPPMVIATDPTSNATGVSVATNVRFWFSEAVFNANSQNVLLLDGATPVSALVDYDPATFEANLDPQRQLLPNHTYTGRVTMGVNDGGVNPLPATFDLTFTTGADTVTPQVIDMVPLPDDADVSVGTNISIRFDEPVVGADVTSFQLNGGAIAGTVTILSSGTLVRFDPTANLPAAATITVSLSSAITDTSGNPITPLAFSFTTM